MAIKASGGAAEIVTEGLNELLRAGGRWQFALDSEVALASTRLRARSRRSVISVAIAPGSPQARIAVIGGLREIEVRIDDFPPDVKPPLVILASMTEKTEPRLAELCPAGTTHWIATFEDVALGEYLVVFEPIE